MRRVSGGAGVVGERVDRLVEGAARGDGLEVLVEQFPIQGVGMVEVDFLALFERDFFHAAVVGIERNDGGPGQLPGKLFGQLGLPGAGRTGDADDVRSHSVVGGVISVYNPRTASTRPSTVKTRASAVDLDAESRGRCAW